MEVNLNDMPSGFGMALAQQPKAAKNFTNMSAEQKQATINYAKEIKSKKEMWSFVSQLAKL